MKIKLKIILFFIFLFKRLNDMQDGPTYYFSLTIAIEDPTTLMTNF